MHKAAAGGHLDVIKFLLPMFGARVHEKDADCYTMLHWAAQNGHCQVARYLIETLNMDLQDRDKVRVGRQRLGDAKRGEDMFQSRHGLCMSVCCDN